MRAKLKLTKSGLTVMKWAQLFLLTLAPVTMAAPAYDEPMDLGQVFGNLFTVVLNVRGLLDAIMLVTSFGLFLGAVARYQKYRQNPVETPLSSVFLLLLVAALLVVLSFIPIQTDKA